MQVPAKHYNHRFKSDPSLQLWVLFPTADCKSVAIICRVVAVRFDSFSTHQNLGRVSRVGLAAAVLKTEGSEMGV